jgi:hypothetical protein
MTLKLMKDTVSRATRAVLNTKEYVNRHITYVERVEYLNNGTKWEKAKEDNTTC